MNGAGRAPARRGFGLTRLRDPIEAAFGRYAHYIYRRAGRTITVVLLGVAALMTLLPRVEIDTSTEGMLADTDPIIVTYDAFRERYGQDQAILIAVETADPFSAESLDRLRALHEDLEAAVPNLQDITSLVNARDTRGEGDRLVVGELLDPWPETDAEREAIRERVRNNPMYLDQLVSSDGRLTTLILLPNAYSSKGIESADLMAGFEEDVEAASDAEPAYLTGEENTEIVEAVAAVVERHRAPDFEILVAGQPVMVDLIMRSMMQDMARFTGMALLVIAVCLAALFRRVNAVLLPLLVSGLAMLCTVSTMPMLDIPISTTTQIMPSFLLAVGVGSAVHILSIFYQAMGRGESREDAVASSLSHSGLAVVMTSLTTAGGLLSFAIADISVISQLGIVTPIGIMAALVFSLVLLPALLAVVPMRESSLRKQAAESRTRGILIASGELATRHPWPMVAVWSVAVVLSIAGAARLELSHDPIAWFPEDDPFRMAMERLNEELDGTMYIDAIISTQRVNAVQSPEFLAKIEEIVALAQQLGNDSVHVGKAISVVDIVKETHRALNENRPEFYTIPQDAALLSQEMLLFENAGAEDLEERVDSQFSEARLTLKFPMADSIYYEAILNELEARAGEILGNDGTIVLTGEMRMMVRLVTLLTSNLVRTYLLAFAIITPLMILLLGSLRMGLISMLPNLAPVVITLGVMGWFGIPMEVFTLLIGSIALGLAVDDTVHFMHNFRRYFERTGDVESSVRETLATTGQALLFTSVVLSSGFFIYTLAMMANLFYFGLLTGITIIVAFLADLLLAPALMALLADYVAQPRRIPSSAESIESVEVAPVRGGR